MLDSIISVSYTHLDVYKRQALQPVSPEDFRKVLVDHLLTK